MLYYFLLIQKNVFFSCITTSRREKIIKDTMVICVDERSFTDTSTLCRHFDTRILHEVPTSRCNNGRAREYNAHRSFYIRAASLPPSLPPP